MQRLRLFVAAIATLAAGANTTARAEPFLVRNQHPVVALFGLPAPLPARLPDPCLGVQPFLGPEVSPSDAPRWLTLPEALVS